MGMLENSGFGVSRPSLARHIRTRSATALPKSKAASSPAVAAARTAVHFAS
jgi:hypothetical protein